ncbi:hypothetical protein [Verrucosispora sp. WMMD1129]|uniref:hypothetical protein n=1 Tax=Verrucosispora sp. WMMD1129 TaxID=3016093 RepID=UPI00249A06A2|nr:hypothetical protein [Verrucosispora sp. WMMD1129]WFE45003.1 hypothetical protein O7624_11970 [Verrucosispora sp. WMMD1129]WFE46287.1 hypothetical protein O7624_19015 [Verrucosispora sp. WMMD1129]
MRVRSAALLVGAFVFATAAGAAIGVQFVDRDTGGEVRLRLEDPQGTPSAEPTPTVVTSTAASPSAVVTPKREGKTVTEQRTPEQKPTGRQSTSPQATTGTGTVDVIKPDPLPEPLPTRSGD